MCHILLLSCRHIYALKKSCSGKFFESLFSYFWLRYSFSTSWIANCYIFLLTSLEHSWLLRLCFFIFILACAHLLIKVTCLWKQSPRNQNKLHPTDNIAKCQPYKKERTHVSPQFLLAFLPLPSSSNLGPPQNIIF